MPGLDRAGRAASGLARRAARPLAELRAARGMDAEADGEDGVEAVESGSVILPVGGSSKEKLYY